MDTHHTGFMAGSRALGDPKYESAMLDMGRKLNWQLGPNPTHADHQAVGQTYLELYLKHHDPAMLAPAKPAVLNGIGNPDSYFPQRRPVLCWVMEIFESLLAGLRTVCAGFPDSRRSADVDYTMADIGLSAFSLFSMQSGSFLAHQRHLGRGQGTSNCHTLFGMKKIPTDNCIRLMLDKVSPEAFDPCFYQVIEQLRERDGLKAFQRLGGRTLVALDGTEYFCSQKLSCPQCLTRKRLNGKTEHYHAMLAAMIVAPGHNMVLPLMPEFIAPQDGAEKQDCKRNGAKRWLIAHGQRVAPLHPVYLGDALFSSQPMAEAVLATGADFLFVCKKDSHKTLYEYVEAAPLDERAVTERKPVNRSLTYRYRWIEGVPLRDGKDAMNVTWLGVSILDAKGKTTYDAAFVTSLAVTADNVVEIAACARARWKIENESFNVLKNNGYNLAHNFWHGKKYLAQKYDYMVVRVFGRWSLPWLSMRRGGSVGCSFQ